MSNDMTLEEIKALYVAAGEAQNTAGEAQNTAGEPANIQTIKISKRHYKLLTKLQPNRTGK